jgi:hypothetical protein
MEPVDHVVTLDEGTRIYYFRHDIHTWTLSSMSKNGESVFLKAPGVVNCFNFDEILHNTTITKPKDQFHQKQFTPRAGLVYTTSL